MTATSPLPPKSSPQLVGVIRRFRWLMVLALALVVIENAAWIAEPSLFGPVIDAMIGRASRQPGHLLLTPLLAWIAVFAINSGVGSFRRSFDQRVYLDMFTELATTISRTGTVQGLSVSTTAARAELSREYITFFQYRVPEILEQAIGIGGALIALTFYDPRIAGSCALIIVPLLFINRIYRTRVRRLQTTVHDRLEQTYDVFQTRDPERVRTYYGEIAHSEQKIANVGALTFGAMRLFLLGIFLVVLYVAIDLDDLSTGTIYSVVAYIWTFVTSSEYLPELMESWGSLKDISRRLQVGEVEPAV